MILTETDKDLQSKRKNLENWWRRREDLSELFMIVDDFQLLFHIRKWKGPKSLNMIGSKIGHGPRIILQSSLLLVDCQERLIKKYTSAKAPAHSSLRKTGNPTSR